MAIVILLHDGSASTYSTPTAALTDAVSGDTICVYQSCTVTSNLAKNGVNWWGPPGVTITRNDDANGYIFDDNNSAMSFSVAGGMSFTRSVDDALGVVSYCGVLRLQNAGSTVRFHFDLCTLSAGSNGIQVNPKGGIVFKSNGTVKAVGNRIVLRNDDTDNGTQPHATWWDNGEMNITCDIIADPASAAPITGGASSFVAIYAHVPTTPTGDFRVSGQQLDVLNETQVAVYDASDNASVATWVNFLTIRGGISSNTFGKVYVTAQKLNQSKINVGNTGTGKFYLLGHPKIGGDLTSGSPYIKLENGNAWLTVSQFEPGTNVQELVNCSNGTHYMHALDMTAASGQDAVAVSGGTLNLEGGQITNGGSGAFDLHQTGGTLNITAAVSYDSSKTSGTVTPSSPDQLAPLQRVNTASLTTVKNTPYVYTGSGTTWTLPPVAGNTKSRVTVKNAGTGALTVQRAGSDNIFDTTTVTSVSLAVGDYKEFSCDGTYWNLET
jgi:hypothetical protein